MSDNLTKEELAELGALNQTGLTAKEQEELDVLNGVKKKDDAVVQKMVTTSPSINGESKLALPKQNPNNGVVPDFRNMNIPGVTNTPVAEKFKTAPIQLKSPEIEKKLASASQDFSKMTSLEEELRKTNQNISTGTKLDNTFQPLSEPVVQNQSRNEVAQLKSDAQAKKESRQSSLAVIPELAQAKNQDDLISKYKNSSQKDNIDFWKELEDAALLSNDELSLNSFFDEKGLSNKDNELYKTEKASSKLEYAYEYQQDLIGKHYNALKERANDYDKILKNKFGEDYLQQANTNEQILFDEDFNKYVELSEKKNAVAQKGASLINDSKYSSVKEKQDDIEAKQVFSDYIAQNDKWYNPNDELRYLKNKVAYGAGHIVKMVAEIPSLATSVDKGYDWTDKLADWGDRFSKKLVDSVPVSSDLKAGGINSVANVNGFKLIVDNDGTPIDVRDKNNFKVNNTTFETVTQTYNSDRSKFKIGTEVNPKSIADNGINTMIDMGILILGTKGIGMISEAEKVSKIGQVGIAYMQTKRDVFNDAIKNGLDPHNADILSNIIGISAGTSSLINPMEQNIATGAGLYGFMKKGGLDATKLALIKEGKLGVKEYAKELTGKYFKNVGGEWFEEVGVENTVQGLANNYFDNKVNKTSETNGGLDTDFHIADRQALETMLITMGAPIIMTPIEMKSQMTYNQQEALKLAIENPEDFKNIRQSQLESGQLTQEQFDSEINTHDVISKQYNSIKEDVKEELQPQLLSLLAVKSNLTAKISEIGDKVLANKYQEKLNDVNASIEGVISGQNASADIVQQQEAVAGNATIQSAVIEINGKTYEGKNHAEAILKAKADGQDISQVNRQAEGKFKLSDGTIIDRAEAKTRFEQDRSEMIIPQDEASNQANKDYAKITSNDKSATPIIEQGKVNNDSKAVPAIPENGIGVQQGDGQNVSNKKEISATEIQKEIDDKKAIISELENNPKSPFHQLVNIDDVKKEVADLEAKIVPVEPKVSAREFLKQKIKEPSVAEVAELEKKQQENPLFEQNGQNKQENKGLNEQKTPVTKTETSEKVVAEIKAKNLTHVKGKNMGENQALGTFVSTEKGNRYETPTQKAEQVEVDIQNPFVVDNGDFGLVDKRQEILNKNRDKFDENHTVDYQKLPDGKITLDNLNDVGIKKLAELTTAELKAQGYDGIYFRESDNQEGELVVFDKDKVR